MTDEEMLEAEKYWCENCCNWDKEQVQMDRCANCKLTGTIAFAQESGKECRFFNVPADNIIVLPCKVGQTVYRISTRTGTRTKYIQETTISRIAIDNEGIWLFCACNPIAKCVFGKTVFLTKEEAEAALKGGVQG